MHALLASQRSPWIPRYIRFMRNDRFPDTGNYFSTDSIVAIVEPIHRSFYSLIGREITATAVDYRGECLISSGVGKIESITLVTQLSARTAD